MSRFVYGPRLDAPVKPVPPPVAPKADPVVTAEYSADLHAVAVALPAFDPAAFTQILGVTLAFIPTGVAVPDDPRALFDDANTPKSTVVPGPAGEAAVLTFAVPEQFDATGCGAQTILELQD